MWEAAGTAALADLGGEVSARGSAGRGGFGTAGRGCEGCVVLARSWREGLSLLGVGRKKGTLSMSGADLYSKALIQAAARSSAVL